MAIQEADESDEETEVADNVEIDNSISCAKNIIHKVKWIGNETKFKCKSYYTHAIVGEIEVKKGDFVMLNSTRTNHPLNIAKIAYMWQEFPQGPMFHAHLFCRGSDTVLGETSDPREIFLVDLCENFPLGSIVRRADVVLQNYSSAWDLEGGTKVEHSHYDDNEEVSFFYTKRYTSETTRFEYVNETDSVDLGGVKFCNSCL